MSVVYLCGGINGLTDAQAKDWRAQAAEVLQKAFEVRDPMARDYRGQEAANFAAIVQGDLEDISHCTAMLVNATRPSWGTAMEIVYAKQQGLFIVAFTGQRDVPPSPWLLYHCNAVMPTLEGAVAHLMWMDERNYQW